MTETTPALSEFGTVSQDCPRGACRVDRSRLMTADDRDALIKSIRRRWLLREGRFPDAAQAMFWAAVVVPAAVLLGIDPETIIRISGTGDS